MSAAKTNRKLHRIGALVAALPLLVILVSGAFLQLKKEVAWIQPTTMSGAGTPPSISFERILEVTTGVPEAGVAGWEDIERLDVRPGRGIVKVRAKSRWEVQIDTDTAAVLQVAYRRSDLIESLHDGSFFHDKVKLWVFLPAGLILIGLWGTGVYLWLLPHLVKRRRHMRRI
ncbi:MAG: PepSY domain-containing protein [Planctomycetota bacterium]|nr:MAG: PepSY domain-containing protein [Planctomycetota bacterium]